MGAINKCLPITNQRVRSVLQTKQNRGFVVIDIDAEHSELALSKLQSGRHHALPYSVLSTASPSGKLNASFYLSTTATSWRRARTGAQL